MGSESSSGQATAVAGKPLRGLLFAALAGLAVLVLAVAALSWGRYFYVRNMREAAERLAESAHLTSLQLAGYLERHRQVTVMVAQELDERRVREPEEVRAVLRRARASNPGLLTMLVADRAGVVRASEPALNSAGERVEFLSENVADRDYFQRPQQTGRPAVSDVFQGRVMGDHVIVAVSAPLRGARGEFDGVVEGSLDLDQLAELEAGRKGEAAGRLVLLDARRQVVYAANREQFPALSVFDGFMLPVVRDAGFGAEEAVLKSADGRASREVIYGWATLRVEGMRGDWLVAVTQGKEVIYAQMREQLAYLGAGVLVAMVIAGLLAGAIARGVTRPIEGLAALARTRARNPEAETTAPAVRSTIREIVEMERDFALMQVKMREAMANLRRSAHENETLAMQLMESRTALEISHHQLEVRVEQRTRVLQQLVERTQAEVQRRIRTEAELEMRNRVMNAIAGGRSTQEVLETIIEGLERDEPDMIASVMILADEGPILRFGAARRLPADYAEAIMEVPIGPQAGSCGTAAYRKERVVVPDVRSDPLWQSYRELVLRTELRACWSSPIFGATGELLGTFAVYHRAVCAPTEGELAAIERASHMAAVALDRARAERAKARLEEQLRQSRKLEAIGTLAGGVAHGFNNLLVPILGYAELLKLDPQLSDAARRDLTEIVRASRQARTLVQQMLAFSRRGAPQLELVNLDRIVAEAGALLRVTAEEHGVELRLEPNAGELQVRADPAELHHLLMNLGTNAVQATPRGGRVTVRTGSVPPQLVPRDAPESALHGSVACLEVSDTGTGISPEVQERMFEPFYTTKPTGRGSGLGLAVVHGIVRSHRGAITVKTALGQGTTFRVFLPAAEGTVALAAPAVPVTQSRVKREARLLVVDDEPVVLAVTATLLAAQGFEVQRELSAAAALAWLGNPAHGCDLLFTDVTMPGMSGVELALETRRLRPGLPVLFATGHGGVEAGRLAEMRPPFRVLAKPADAETLVAAVDALLADGRSG